MLVSEHAAKKFCKNGLKVTDLRQAQATFGYGTPSDICASTRNMPFQITVEGITPKDWNAVDERCRMIWHVRECERTS
jgi:hypothetical protein